jgi:hypothetical protein
MAFRCGPMEAGRWKVRFWQRKLSQPLIYEIELNFLPPKSVVDSAASFIDVLQSDWQLENVVLVSGEKQREPEVIASPATTSTTPEMTTNSRIPCPEVITVEGTFHDWCVCGGGLVTIILGVQFAYLGLIQPYISPLRPNRVHRRWSRGTFLIIVISSALQLWIRTNYCR